MRIHLQLNVLSLYHTIFKKQGSIVKFLPKKWKSVKMSQKLEKPMKKPSFQRLEYLNLAGKICQKWRSQTVYTNSQRKSKLPIDNLTFRDILQSNERLKKVKVSKMN